MTAPFALLEDYIEAFGNTSTAGGDSDMQVRAALAAACADIRAYCSQDFTLVEDDEITLHGTGSAIVILPQLPVVAVNSVTLNKGEDSEEAITDFRFDSASGELYRKSTGWCWRVWPAGFLNITVDYNHGWDTVPANLVRVAVKMAREGLTPGGSRMTSESLGSYSYTKDTGEPLVNDFANVLDFYRTPRIPVA